MKIAKISPKKALNKAFLKQRPLRSEIELFKSNLIRLLNKIDEIEREENQKNHLRDFLRDTYYKDTNEINTKDTKDLVIHLGKSNKDNVGIIIEAKRPGNKTEMISDEKPNAKAFQELVLYYLRERIEENNIDIKYLIATNVYEWYIFEASYFEKYFYKNKSFVKQYEEWRDGKKVTKDTNLFYNDIAKPYIDNIHDEIPCIYFDIRAYEGILRNTDKDDDKNLIALQKILSPYFLLKVPFANDSNSLDERFYKELLYIMGLEEYKDGNKSIIRRKINNRQPGSLIENVINILETEDILYRFKDKTLYGQTKDEQLFGIALELSLTWINRILFLKLLEGLLITYHKGNKEYLFLNTEVIKDFDELYKLFHQVLARNINDRPETIKQKFAKVPYLNSSLFEISELEDATIRINSLDNNATIKLMDGTILKDEKKKNTALPTLEYLFKFLDAYDFASEGGEDIAEDNKTIINASVLGKVFEKINGYKDGSIFTPSFITMYMSRQALRLAVVQKFNEYFKNHNLPEVKTFEELYNRIDKIGIEKANEIVNSLRVCDPAVGSGHFLVSVLNEIIVIKSELGILIDSSGKRLRDYEIVVENDELIIFDDNGIFEYNYRNKESQRVQETIFNEKKTIIENCLFGVDINPNSVKICCLRLWIELLKNAYYKPIDCEWLELETLPNIDINIKCGNSLVNRFDIDADLKRALRDSKWNIETYRIAVTTYQNAKNKDEKRSMEQLINEIKNNFETEIKRNDKRYMKLVELRGELFELTNQTALFDKTEKEKKEWNKKVEEITQAIQKQEAIIEEIKNAAIYKNAFEWRFEFPEVLNDNGDFVGFDVVIGNPPYIQLQSMKEISEQLKQFNYETFEKTGDIYALFYERGTQILKNNGYLAYITSNKWMRAGYGKKLREFFIQYNPLQLIDLGPGVFEHATVDTNILILQKASNQNQLKAVTLQKEDKENIAQTFDKKGVVLTKLTSDAWFIGSDAEQRLKEKIERIGKPLKDWDVKIYRGVLTGLNEAFIITTEKRNEILANCLDEAERERTEAIIKPILRGRDIKRYHYEWAGLWVIGTFPTLRLNIDDYPALKKYFLDNFDIRQLEQSGKKYPELGFDARKKTGNKWFETQDQIAYYPEFEKEKVVWAETDQALNAVIVDKGIYLQKTCFMIITLKLKFISAILNSSVSQWYIRKLSSNLGNKGLSLTKDSVKEIPLPPITPSNEPIVNQIEALVDKILAAKQQNPQTDTGEWEKEIDRLVYRLYDLTEEEIEIIEGGK